MKGERTTPRLAITLGALALAAAAAAPAGWALGDWVMFGGRDFGADLARRWILVPAAAVLILAGGVVARRVRSRLWLAAPVLILAVLALGAWQAVGARVDAYREGPLNAAL
jgi:hypothetical protein